MSQDARAFLIESLPGDSVGAEIGVHNGDFSARLLTALRPWKLHLIDPWIHHTDEAYRDAWYGGRAADGQKEMDARYQAVCRRFARDIRCGVAVVHRKTSAEALAELSEQSLDWVYIDGNHRYEYVMEDLRLSLARTRVGGLVTGDDYGDGGWWQGGVKKAVDEFCCRDDVSLEDLRNGQFILRRLA